VVKLFYCAAVFGCPASHILHTKYQQDVIMNKGNIIKIIKKEFSRIASEVFETERQNQTLIRLIFLHDVHLTSHILIKIRSIINEIQISEARLIHSGFHPWGGGGERRRE
jgi:isocitrate dehydrogenase